VLTALVLSLMLEAAAPAADRAAASADAPGAAPEQPQTRLTLPTFAPATETAQAIRGVWREHPSIRAGRNLRLDFTFRVQEDVREAGDDPNPAEFPTWELHRLRLGIEGEIFRHIQFQVEREFKYALSSVNFRTPWRDVFVDVDYLDKAQVRVGRFKIPIGLDQLGGDTALDTIFRSLGGQYLAPGRDQGVMVHGRFFKRGLNYWVGGFLHDGENSKSSKMVGGDETFAARLTGRPFRRLKGPFAEAEVGTSFALTNVSDESVYPNGLRARTVLSQYTVFDSVFVKGLRRRLGFDIDVSPGPFGVQADVLQVMDAREAQGLGNQDLSDARARSWYLAGSWVVTGEPKAGGVVPRKGLFMGGLGAVEVAARYDQIRFDSKQGIDPPFSNSRAETILPGGNRVWTFGVNWFVNRWSRIQFNAIREHSMDEGRSPTLDGTPFWSKLVRFQLEL
jgi:phosphate-selective porin OprO/OprP